MPRRSLAQRRYVIRVTIATAFYLVFFLAALHLVRGGIVTGAPAFAIALLPGLAHLAMFWAIGRLLVEEEDEYLRMRLVRQALVATAFALSVATVWGFLESFGLVPHAEAFYVAALWFAAFGGYGVGGEYHRFAPDDASAS